MSFLVLRRSNTHAPLLIDEVGLRHDEMVEIVYMRAIDVLT